MVRGRQSIRAAVPLTAQQQQVKQQIRDVQSSSSLAQRQIEQLGEKRQQLQKASRITRQQLQVRGRAGIIAQAKKQREVKRQTSLIKSAEKRVKDIKSGLKDAVQKLIKADTRLRKGAQLQIKIGGTSRVLSKSEASRINKLLESTSISEKESKGILRELGVSTKKASQPGDLIKLLESQETSAEKIELLSILEKQKFKGRSPQVKEISEFETIDTKVKIPTIDKFKIKVKDIAKDISRRFPGPSSFEFLRQDLIKEQKLFPSRGDVIVEESGFPGGTVVFTQREKTFFEKLNINPNDKSARTLKGEIEITQKLLDDEKISENFANQSVNQSIDKFTKVQILKGIPRNIAIGAALGIAPFIPVIGPVIAGVAGVALTGDAFIKREEVAKQFIKFPKESALATSAFLAGGLIGSVGASAVKGRLVRPQINPAEIESVSFIAGKNKNKLTGQLAELDSGFNILRKNNRITDTVGYIIKLKDGRVFKGIEFSKLNTFGAKGLKGARELMVVEIGGRGEVLFGRAAQLLKKVGKQENFIRIIKFKQANTKLSRFIQRRFPRGKIIDLVQKSKIIGRKGKLAKEIITIETKTGVIKVSKVRGNLIKQALKLKDEISKGKKVPLHKLRDIINLDRRLSGKKPFTAKEFADAGLKTSTRTELLVMLKKIELRRGDVKFKGGIGEQLRIVTKSDIAGGGFSKRLVDPLIKKSTFKRTPLSKTFPREKLVPKTIKQLKGLSKKTRDSVLVLADKIKSKQEPFTSSVTGPEIITSVVEQRTLPPITRPSVTLQVSIATSGLSSSQLSDVSTRLEQRIKLKQQQIQRVKQSLVSPQAVATSVALATKQAVALKQQLKQVQKLKQQSRARATTKPKTPFPIPPIPKLTPIPFGGISAKTGKIVPILVKKPGYFAEFKPEKGRNFVRINKIPATKRRAQDAMAWLVDRTLSAKGRIIKSRKPARFLQLNIPKGYFNSTQGKFREFKIRGGKRIPTPNTWIEKRGKPRLDTFSERKRIRGFQELARLRKNKLRKFKPIKLKSTFGKKKGGKKK